jgi:hypothetical protein
MLKVNLPSQKSVVYFGTLLVCLFIVVALPSLLPVQSDAQKQSNVDWNARMGQTATAASIFLNNFLISLIALVPLVGWSYLLAALWKTGLVIASYPSLSGFAVAKLGLFCLFELGVYSFVVLQSVKIVQLRRKRRWRLIGKTIIFTIAVSMVVLLLSAIIEYTIIHSI